MATNEAPVAAPTFEELLRGVIDIGFGVACHLTRSRTDADDLVQEASLRAFRAFHQFQTGTNFKAWYLRILTNCYYADYRKRRRQPQIESLDDGEPLHMLMKTAARGWQGEGDPATNVIGRMTEEQIAAAIGALPEEFRIVCALYFMQDASYQEISEAVGCPIGTVRSRLHRGRRMLQQVLWKLADEEGILQRVKFTGGEINV